MLLYIVRHADPVYSPDSLTEKGRRQAEAVGRRLAARAFSRVYASSNVRAQLTARPFCELTRLPLQIEDWMSENHAWEELSIPLENGERTWSFMSVPNTYFRSEESLRAGDDWYHLSPFAQIDGQKAYERIVRASDDFLARQGYRREGRVYRAVRPNDERVAVFCHQGFGLTWLSHLLQIPPNLFYACFDVSHSSVTILEFQNQPDGYTAPKCLCLSDLSHIYEARLPMTYNNELEI